MADDREQLGTPPGKSLVATSAVSRRTILIWLVGLVSAEAIASGITWQKFVTGNFFVPSTSCQGFSDRFQQNDLGGWTWLDPSGASSYNFDRSSHYLHIYSPGTVDEDLNPYNNLNAPRMLQSVNGDFSIETQIDFIQQPDTYQGAALLIWASQNQFIRLEISAWNNKYYGLNFVYYNMSDPKNQFHDLGDKLLVNPPTVKLRMERKGNVFSGAWQQGTRAWKPIVKTYTMTPSGPLQAGLVLMNSAIPPLPQRPAEASFHYFHLSCL